MKKLATISALLLFLLMLVPIVSIAGDWEVFKQFDFDDFLDQVVVVGEGHGYLLAGQSLYEFTQYPPTSWTKKTDLPSRIDPANPGEELSYSTYRMAAWGDTIVVVGSKGTIFTSSDAGASWTDLSDTAYIKVTFEWVQGPNSQNVWICGGTSSPKKGYVLRLENLSDLTRKDVEEMDYKLSEIFFTDAMHGHAVAGGTKGDYFRTEDGGATWTEIAGNFKGGTSGRIYDMTFASQNVGYAAGYYGYLYKTTDGGASIWQQIETPEREIASITYLLTVFALNENEIFVGGKEGRLYYSADGGASFELVRIPNGNNFKSLWFSAANEGIALSSYVVYHAKPGNPVDWEPLVNWTADSYANVAVDENDKLCLVATDGMYSYGSPDELTISQVAIPGVHPNLKNAYFGNGKAFLMGYKSLILSDDDMQSWFEVLNVDSGLKKYAHDISFVDADTAYMGDSGGTLWKTTNGGYNWQKLQKIGTGLYRVIFTDWQTGYALDYKEEQIQKTTDGAASWTAIPVTDITKCYFYDMEMLNDSTLIIAGYDATQSGASKGLIVKSTDYGATWKTVFHSNITYKSLNLYSIEFNGDIGYASGNNGVILKSEDGGDTWNEEASPVAGKMVYLYGGKFLSNGDFYAAGNRGYVLRKLASTGVEAMKNAVVNNYQLSQNFPNPFNPTTDISFALPTRSHVKLSVYNALGQKVATLVEGMRQAGSYRATWNAQNMPSGIYFYRLETDSFSKTLKMILMK
ncbi:MAG: T9SS type A sorting domain-containing protein [Calditrichaeota bacterium]|nr:T9SS type A sorting domain-containing protein [Calditrichota bacterium]